MVMTAPDTYQAYVCGVCGIFVTEISGVTKIPCVHDYVDFEVISAAECTKSGEVKQVCSKCKKIGLK